MGNRNRIGAGRINPDSDTFRW
uniref:Uncharacterized protein n=1 Tax=Rhizophora mucronata TaxID=61149 RepID=A0A2P2QL96_RHIMU